MLVGLDVVNVERFEKLVNNNSFLQKYFTEYEREYIFTRPKPVETLAGLYAAKEAFLKALGIGIGRGVDLIDIQINHDELGKPFYNVSNYTKLEKFNFNSSDLSISHTNNVSTAICVLI